MKTCRIPWAMGWGFQKYQKSTKTKYMLWFVLWEERSLMSKSFHVSWVSPEKRLESQTCPPVKEQLDALKDGTMSSNQRLREMEVSLTQHCPNTGFFGGEKWKTVISYEMLDCWWKLPVATGFDPSEMLESDTLSSPNSFSYRDSYFKYRGEGSQIFWIRSVGQGVGRGVVNGWYLPMLFGVMQFWEFANWWSCSAIEKQVSGFCPFLFTTWIKRCDACFRGIFGGPGCEMDDGCWVWWYRLGIVWHAGVTLQWWTCALAGVLRNQEQASIHVAKCCSRHD